MQRFHDFFEQRKMTVDLSIPYRGKHFTITEAPEVERKIDG